VRSTPDAARHVVRQLSFWRVDRRCWQVTVMNNSQVMLPRARTTADNLIGYFVPMPMLRRAVNTAIPSPCDRARIISSSL